jgi:DUF4097 and DUF4098 domain-containing protein YvlB
MKKNIYLILITVITVCCIIGGTAYHMLGWFSLGWFSFLKTSASESVSFDNALSDFSEISIDCSVADITIKSGSDYRLSFSGVSDLEPTASVKDGVLTIKQPNSTIIGLHNTNNCEMTLTVPADSKLDSINVSSDVGNISVEDLTASAVSVSSDVGDVTLTGCDFSEIDASANIGDIEFHSGIDLSDAEISLITDLGTVSVNGSSYKTEFKQESSVKDSNRSLSAETDMGDISVEY